MRPKEDDRGNLYQCPECDCGNPGWVVLLRFLYRFPTEFHGVLRYFRCPECRWKFVMREHKGAEPEITTA